MLSAFAVERIEISAPPGTGKRVSWSVPEVVNFRYLAST
jgi:hypothetical protein